MADPPRGMVTFLFTDIEGSTALWERDRTAMRDAVNQHLALLREVIVGQGGVAFKTVGDAMQAAFAAAPALAAAVAGQRALQTEAWSEATGALRVRMALHAGIAEPIDGDYLAPCLNRLSRLPASGHGQQVLLTETVRRLLEGELPDPAEAVTSLEEFSSGECAAPGQLENRLVVSVIQLRLIRCCRHHQGFSPSSLRRVWGFHGGRSRGSTASSCAPGRRRRDRRRR